MSAGAQAVASGDPLARVAVLSRWQSGRNHHDPRGIYQQIEEMFSSVPTFFKTVPDSSLELEWQLFKRVQFDEGPIPNKYRELIGVAISAVTKCHYCAFYHTEVARLYGATDAEIEDAVHYAKSSAGWSTYLTGMQVDLDQFKQEVLQACEHVRATHGG
jgi:AhpD family alkylhydroperoxidase